jgi:hypothetical protein
MIASTPHLALYMPVGGIQDVILPLGSMLASDSTANLAWFQLENTPVHVWQLAIALLVLLGTPVLVAAWQGAAAVLSFREKYADAPVPKIPSHGLVIASSSESATASTNSTTAGATNNLYLRLLVVGDSLAVGVGQSSACTPILPQAIATSLSASLDGTPVLWSCFGETGASTPWIVHTLNQPNSFKYPQFRVGASTPACQDGDNLVEPCEDFVADGVLVQEDASKVQYWKTKLSRVRETFNELYLDPDLLEPFDIVVLLTGTNDLKSSFFPFLLDKDERDDAFRDDKTGSVDDVAVFIETLTDKMEGGMKKVLADIRVAAEEILSVTIESTLDAVGIWEFDTDRSTQGGTTSTASTDMDPARVRVEPVPARPLFVLPAMPVRLVPAFRKVPLSWFSTPVFDAMNRKREKFSCRDKHAGNTTERGDLPHVLFVEELLINDALEYETRHGRVWDEKRREKVQLRIRDISQEGCRAVESEMEAYYEDAAASGRLDTLHSTVPLSEWPGKPGTKVFSIDTIHPTEAGYDMWGTL